MWTRSVIGGVVRIEDRLPDVGEVGWTVFCEETPEQWLTDVISGREPDSNTPGGYGWPCDAKQHAAERALVAKGRAGGWRYAYDGRAVKTITVVFVPTLDVDASSALEAAIEYARKHAEESDDPDHEAGDLQMLVRALALEAGSTVTLRAVREFLAFVKEA